MGCRENFPFLSVILQPVILLLQPSDQMIVALYLKFKTAATKEVLPMAMKIIFDSSMIFEGTHCVEVERSVIRDPNNLHVIIIKPAPVIVLDQTRRSKSAW